MKVVLFCGGLGTRLRDYSENIPKPMVTIGYRPILWQIMRYYAHFGHKDFILCLGYKADFIKNYFIGYDERISNDFVLAKGGKEVKLLNTDIKDWKITFVDTGIDSNIGERLLAVKKYLKNEEIFLANYSDGLTDMRLNKMIDTFAKTDNTAALMAYQPVQSFHVLRINDENNTVKKICHISDSGLWMNTGYFIFRNEIFNYIKQGEELVEEPFHRLIQMGKLLAYKHDGFWASMDTFKDKQKLDDSYAKGKALWEVWKTPSDNKAKV